MAEKQLKTSIPNHKFHCSQLANKRGYYTTQQQQKNMLDPVSLSHLVPSSFFGGI